MSRTGAIAVILLVGVGLLATVVDSPVPTDAEFRSAVINGRVETVRWQLRNNPMLTRTTFSGQSALHVAVRAPEPEMLTELLPHFEDASPFDRRGYTPLHIAVLLDRPGFAKLLLDHGADPDATGPTGIAGQYGESPVAVAAMMGSSRCVELLLKSGGSADGPSHPEAIHTPAILAAIPLASDRSLTERGNSGNVEILRILQEAGADLDRGDATGTNPLWAAVKELRVSAVEALLSLGVDVNHVHSMRDATVLHALAGTQERIVVKTAKQRERARKIVKLLLEAGGDLTKKERKGRTVLECAKQNRRAWLFEVSPDDGEEIK